MSALGHQISSLTKHKIPSLLTWIQATFRDLLSTGEGYYNAVVKKRNSLTDNQKNLSKLT